MSSSSMFLVMASFSTSTTSESWRSLPPLPPIGTRSKFTPSLWMDSTKSMKAGVPMTDTVSRCSLPKYMRRRPRPRVCSGRMLLVAE